MEHYGTTSSSRPLLLDVSAAVRFYFKLQANCTSEAVRVPGIVMDVPWFLNVFVLDVWLLGPEQIISLQIAGTPFVSTL